ncbi:hypothetical protein [Alteromonas genovensis]|uniref:hypothetical protein n=1 Tax=Alteromonas genovensis TaxID=471225 RepID=UPI002FDFA15C
MWYPQLTIVDVKHGGIDQSNLSVTSEQSTKKTVALFSGGVDSFYTLLRRRTPKNEGTTLPVIGELHGILNVWGFDIPLDKEDEYREIENLLDSVSAAYGVKNHSVKTNIKQTRFSRALWGGLSHGAALAGIGHLFSNDYSELLIGSSHALPDLQRWGSHALTDPLFSSMGMTIVHDGANASRVEKTSLVAQSTYSLQKLRVCWKHGAANNCSSCPKCLRTMTTLKLLGKEKEASSFDFSNFSPKLLTTLHLQDASDVSFIDEILDLAAEYKNKEILEGLQTAKNKSKVYSTLVNVLGKLQALPFVWRYREKLIKSVLSSRTT